MAKNHANNAQYFHELVEQEYLQHPFS